MAKISIYDSHFNIMAATLGAREHVTAARKPFLDTLVTAQEDGSLSTSIYRKPTHTNQYLQWDSHHSIANKYSVINSLLHRATNIYSNHDQLKEELTYVERALTACKYPSWAIQRIS